MLNGNLIESEDPRYLPLDTRADQFVFSLKMHYGTRLLDPEVKQRVDARIAALNERDRQRSRNILSRLFQR